MVRRPKITREQQSDLEAFHSMKASTGQLKAELDTKAAELSGVRLELRNSKASLTVAQDFADRLQEEYAEKEKAAGESHKLAWVGVTGLGNVCRR